MSRIHPFSVVRRLRLLVLLLVVAPTVRAQDRVVAVADSLPALSRATLGRARSDVVIYSLEAYGASTADLRRVYGEGTPVLLWTRNGVLTSSARATMAALQRVGDRGLDSSALDLARLQTLAGSRLRSDAERFEFDALLSVASIRVLRALHGARVETDDDVRGSGDMSSDAAGNTGIGGRPRAVPDSDTARRGPVGDVTLELRALAAAAHPDAILDAAEPAALQYQLLKAALGTYRTLAGRDTVARGQLASILATLERARTQRDSTLTAGVVVNIPAFTLHATGGSSADDTLRMDVVVGVAGRHRTLEMRDSIRYIVFAPYWDVPLSIVRAELLPIARRDPRLLTLNNYQLVDRRGRVLPATVQSVNLLAAGRVRIRQLPGGTNSLGRVKFMFPNADDIYLHDTPMQRDFARYRRDLSHGCVRVADPAALARLLLRDQPDWTTERIDAAMRGMTPVTIRLSHPVPIRLTYATAVARADGGIDFFDDIYGLDAAKRPSLASP